MRGGCKEAWCCAVVGLIVVVLCAAANCIEGCSQKLNCGGRGRCVSAVIEGSGEGDGSAGKVAVSM